MKSWLLAPIGALLLCPLSPAQDEAMASDFSPAAGLAQFERTLGDWRSSGKVWMAPGADPMPWSSTSRVQKILGGHVIQEDTRIEFAPGMPALHFRSFVGWDRAADRPVAYSIANTGEGGRQEVRWIDANTLVTTSDYVEAGVPVCERSVIEYADGAYTLRVDRARGKDPFYPYVQGEARRVADGDASFGALPGAYWSPTGTPLDCVAQLAKLAGMAGHYELSGKVQAVPGMPDMEISGEDEVALMYGGSILRFHGQGGVPGGLQWEGYGYQWWEPERSCYMMLHLDNMGGIGTADVYLVDGRKVVSTSARVYMGQPLVERSIIELDEAGHIARVSAHGISGTGAPSQTFAGEYTRVEVGGAAATSAAFTPGSCCDKARKAGSTCSHPCCVKSAEAGEVCKACN